MRLRLFRVTGFLLAAAILAPISARAQTTAAGPYYAAPSWDQTLPAAARFIVLSNFVDAAHPSGGAAVLDRETGLVWERSPALTPLPWSNALEHCNETTTGGRLGWKLPSIQEVNSLNDPNVSTFPFLPPGHPFAFGLQPFVFWSSTANAGFPDNALVANFIIGILPRAFPQPKEDLNSAWCVRGGAGVDAQ